MQGGTTKVRIADGVDEHPMRRQGLREIEEIRDDDRNEEDLVIQQELERRVAFSGGDQQEHRDRFFSPSIGQHGDGAGAKSRSLMYGRRSLRTVLEQNERQASMGLGMIRGQAQRRLIFRTRPIQFPLPPQQIAEIEVSEWI